MRQGRLGEDIRGKLRRGLLLPACADSRLWDMMGPNTIPLSGEQKEACMPETDKRHPKRLNIFRKRGEALRLEGFGAGTSAGTAAP